MKDADPAPHRSLAIGEGVPGEPKPRSKILLLVYKHLLRNRNGCIRVGIEEVRHFPVLLHRRRRKLVPQSQVERQIRCDLDVILKKSPEQVRLNCSLGITKLWRARKRDRPALEKFPQIVKRGATDVDIAFS